MANEPGVLRHWRSVGIQYPPRTGGSRLGKLLRPMKSVGPGSTPEDRERIQQEVGQALADLDECSSEFRVVWPDSSIHWLLAKGRVFRDSGGEATRVLGVNMDITERKQTEQALRESVSSAFEAWRMARR